MKRLTLVLLLIVVFPYIANASFTEVGIGARPLGMGGAFSAVADDANATLWNPAGLCQVAHFELSSMYVKLYGLDVGSQFLSLCSGNFWSGGGIGASALTLGEKGLYSETSYILSVSQDLTSLLKDKVPIAAGLSLKHLRVGYSGFDKDDPLFEERNSVYGDTFDLGFIYQVKPEIKVALVWQNILSPSLSINEEDKGNSLSRIFRFGGAYTWYRDSNPEQTDSNLEQICVAVEYKRQALSDEVVDSASKLGSEIWWNIPKLGSQFALRFGAGIFNSDIGFTLGGGYRCVIQKVGLEFDYALYYSADQDLGEVGLDKVHRVSLAVAY